MIVRQRRMVIVRIALAVGLRGVAVDDGHLAKQLLPLARLTAELDDDGVVIEVLAQCELRNRAGLLGLRSPPFG